MAVVAVSWMVRPACAPRLVAQKAVVEPTASCSCNLRPKRALQQKSRGKSSSSMVVRASNADDNMDDEGVVKDMERYLNELSVEYENVWDTKPFWIPGSKRKPR